MEYEIHGMYPTHPDVAISLLNIGSVFREQGKLHESELYVAELYVWSCLAMLYQIHWDYPDLAVSKCDLDEVIHDKNKLVGACTCLKSSLESVLYNDQNSDHLQIANAMNWLGCIYLSQKRNAESETYLNKSLSIQRRIFGQEACHPDIAKSLEDLGDLYADKSELTKAMEAYKESLRMYTKLQGNVGYKVIKLRGIVQKREAKDQRKGNIKTTLL
eukprot:m.236618 g.236618  ORF g.236618 m.236618 type:complete len:216 (-) comp16052_c0_seq1:78-725(-)